MSDNNQAGTACDLRGIREAVCVHTDKISDSCLAKDCIEDLPGVLNGPVAAGARLRGQRKGTLC